MESEVWTDEVWNRKYERGPIRIDSILSIHARMASQERAEQLWRIVRLVSDPTSNCSRGQFLDEWAIWSSEGAPAKLRFNLVWAAQCAPKSRENSLYDPAHGAPELPESSGICPSPPCGHAWSNLHLQPHISSGGTS